MTTAIAAGGFCPAGQSLWTLKEDLIGTNDPEQQGFIAISTLEWFVTIEVWEAFFFGLKFIPFSDPQPAST